MHPLAARTVRLVLDAGGKLDPIESYDDIAALDAAARSTTELPLWRVCDLLDRPVIVGDPNAPHGKPAVLWSPSYAALNWIADTALECGKYQDLCCAWALAMARQPRILRERGADPRLAIRAAHEWASDLNCSIEALLHAAAELLVAGRPDDPPPERKPGDLPPKAAERLALARLVKELGQNEDYWLFGPVDRTNAALEYLRRLDDAEIRAAAGAHGKAVARDPDSPEVKSFRRWQAAREKFIKKYLPEAQQ